MKMNRTGGKLIALLISGLLISACSQRVSNKRISIGPDAKASMVIYFKEGVTNEQINKFLDEVPTRPDPQGKGFISREGVQSVLRVFQPVEGHEAIAITFFPDANQEAREVIKREAKSHPIVYKVLEDVAPAEVKNLD